MIMAQKRVGHFHKGVDINIGSKEDDFDAPVYATHDGVVVRVASVDSDMNGGGNRVKIESEDKSVATFYMHLETIDENVLLGAKISEGQQIGTVGGTGYGKHGKFNSHLHYEITINGRGVNPAQGEEHLLDPQKIMNQIYYGGVLEELIVIGTIITTRSNNPSIIIPINEFIDINNLDYVY